METCRSTYVQVNGRQTDMQDVMREAEDCKIDLGYHGTLGMGKQQQPAK